MHTVYKRPFGRPLKRDFRASVRRGPDGVPFIEARTRRDLLKKIRQYYRIPTREYQVLEIEIETLGSFEGYTLVTVNPGGRKARSVLVERRGGRRSRKKL